MKQLEQKIDLLVEKVLFLTGKVEQRAKANEYNNSQAQQLLVQAGQSLSGATHEIHQVTSNTAGRAIENPVHDFEHGIKIIRDDLIHTSNAVRQHVDASVKALKRVIGLATGAFILAGIVCVGASAYALMLTRQEIKKAEWIGSINAAIANGKLPICPEGGICALVDKKLARLDNKHGLWPCGLRMTGQVGALLR